MFIATNFYIRAFSTLCFASVQAGIFFNTFSPVAAQTLPPSGESPVKFPSPPTETEVLPASGSNEISPQFKRYLLGPGDVLNVTFQRPAGPYRLGPGDAISVVVQRFPDLSFQTTINPEGNITVPLLETVSLQDLTLQEAQEKIRLLLNRYVINPVVVLSLAGQRPDLSLPVQVNPEFHRKLSAQILRLRHRKKVPLGN